MQLAFLLTLIFTFFDQSITSQSMVLSGVYQGKNLYVQNPFTSNLKDFCTDEVYVNDIKILSQIKSSAFEIDLSELTPNTPVTIKLLHKEDCKPKVLNPQVIRVSNSFQFNNVSADQNSISFITKGEKPSDKIILEQFLYNSWVPIKEIPAKGSSSNNNYILDVRHNSGLNRYRLKLLEKEGNVFYSGDIEYTSSLPEVTFYPKRVANKIYLSRVTDFEVIDGNGNTVARGNGKEIPCEQLKEGVYYLNVDNKTEKFLKK